MFETELTKYRSLNKFAESDGIVIFGGREDVNIPLGELKQAFSLHGTMYNRSFPGLSVSDAAGLYEACVADLCPETILLHIGEDDAFGYLENEISFAEKYRALIRLIKVKNKGCRIVIIFLKNYENDPIISQINQALCDIARSENCEWEDISARCAKNTKENRETSAFLYDLGFDRPLKIKRPIYNLVRIIFCYNG